MSELTQEQLNKINQLKKEFEEWKSKNDYTKDIDMNPYKQFLLKYPKSKILNKDLNLEEYVLGKDGNFCRFIEYKLNYLASIGQGRAKKWYLYSSGKRFPEISDYNRKVISNEKAENLFSEVKEELKQNFVNVESKEISKITCNTISQIPMLKIFSLYYPNNFLMQFDEVLESVMNYVDLSQYSKFEGSYLLATHIFSEISNEDLNTQVIENHIFSTFLRNKFGNHDSITLHSDFKKIFTDFNEANFYFDSLNEIISRFDLNSEVNKSLVLSKPVDNKSLNLIIANIYLFTAIKKKFTVTLNVNRKEVINNLTPYEDTEETFKEVINGNRYKNYYITINQFKKFKDLIFEDFKEIFEHFKNRKSNYVSNHSKPIEKMIENKETRKEYLINGINNEQNDEFTETKKNSDNLAKNIILYGPPGTGKTYCLKDKVREISGED